MRCLTVQIVTPEFPFISNPLILLSYLRSDDVHACSLLVHLCMGCFKYPHKFISLSFTVQLAQFTTFLLHYNAHTTVSFSSKGVPVMMPLSALTACLSIAKASDILQIAP